MGTKSDFITALRDTPDGIVDFTETPLPAMTTFASPATVDDAIIAQGILAYNLNNIFIAFEGLTPIELLLRIGQHSNVAEALLFSALEYLDTSGGQNKIAVQHPEPGKVYAPGDLQIVVQEVNGAPHRITAGIDNLAIDLDAQDGGIWEGVITLEDSGDYTLVVHAEYAKGEPATASVSFSISAEPGPTPPDPPGGKDKTAITAAKTAADQSYTSLIKTIAATADRTTLAANYQAWKAKIETYVAAAKAGTRTPSVYNDDIALLAASYARVSTAIQNRSEGTGTAEDLAYEAGALQSIVDHVQGIATSINL